MIVLKMPGDLFSDRMEEFFEKMVEAEAQAGTPKFDRLMDEVYALYYQLSDEQRLWLDEHADQFERPTIN